MSRIQLVRPFTQSREEVIEIVTRLGEKLHNRYQLDCQWQDDYCLSIRRSGIDGQVVVAEDELQIELKLGLLMSAFSSTIEQELNDALDLYLNA